MRHLALFALVVLAADADGRDRRCRGARDARLQDSCAGYAFFEAFPASGAGTSGACSTTPPTGARGEVLTFTRASAATCTRTAAGGLATTGIADGDLVSLTNNLARVEYDSAGTLGLLVEAAGINVLLRSDAPGNALWADVGTPTLTGSQTDPFGGTTGVTIEDNDGAAFEGRSIATTVTAATAYFMHCYVKAGTHDQARISIDGTTFDVTGLSTTTWKIVEGSDASSSGVSIPVQILVGDAAADTGTVIWGGCDIKAGTYRTSVVPTAGAAVTRVAENGYFTMPSTEAQCIASTITSNGRQGSNTRVIGDATSGVNTLTGYSAGPTAQALHTYQAVGGTKDFSGPNVPLTGVNRLVAWAIPATTIGAVVNGTETTNSAGVQAAVTGVTKFYVGCYAGGAGYESDAIHTRVQLDPVATRCSK